MAAPTPEQRRGQLSAWLQKKKSGASMVRVRQYNKRYFTIDFDSRVFFYSHSEGSKKVSSMIPFADIMDVALPEQHAEHGETASQCSRQSRGSWLKRLSGSGSKMLEEEHMLTVLTKPDKTLELLCSSAAEAQQWCEAFRAAMADAGDGDSPVAFSSNRVESPSSNEGAREGAEDGKHQEPASIAASGATSGRAEARPEDAPPVKGTFLDLSTQPEAPKPRQSAAEEVVAVENLSPGKLEASQFGFDGIEEGSSSASSPPGTPKGAGRSADAADAATSAPGSRPATGRRSYADQHEGRSMQERLASLEFSDAEDDDDPLGLGTSKGS